MQVEGSVVHIMKALAAHPSAAQSLIEDNSLQLLFQMVANGSLVAFSQYKEGLVPLHTIQLHRHAMQVKRMFAAAEEIRNAKALGVISFIYMMKFQFLILFLFCIVFSPDTWSSPG